MCRLPVQNVMETGASGHDSTLWSGFNESWNPRGRSLADVKGRDGTGGRACCSHALATKLAGRDLRIQSWHLSTLHELHAQDESVALPRVVFAPLQVWH